MEKIVVRTKRDKIRVVKNLIKLAGNRMTGITFIKREDGSSRKICGRFKVSKPTYAHVPSGKKMKYNPKEKNLATIFDCNVLRYNRSGKLNGRGDWRCFGMDSVKRMKINGVVYKFA